MCKDMIKSSTPQTDVHAGQTNAYSAILWRRAVMQYEVMHYGHARRAVKK